MAPWTSDNIPDQTGRTAIVTGANTGVGFETAKLLALKGAHVVLACRDPGRGEAAVQRILALKPAGGAFFARLDLSDLDSVAAFARDFQASHARLDLLVNNAGIMATPFGHTRQGFELQFGTNHLGHFALTRHLLPLLEATPGARVVVVSSLMHHFGQIELDDLQWTRRTYQPQPAYNASKLANLMFVLELQRRLTAAGSKVLVVGAHPGTTRSELTRSMGKLVQMINPWFASATEGGALPTLRAATDASVTGGSYWGPSRFLETRGPPTASRVAARAKDADKARRLFEASEKLTGLVFPFAPEAPVR